VVNANIAEMFVNTHLRYFSIAVFVIALVGTPLYIRQQLGLCGSGPNIRIGLFFCNRRLPASRLHVRKWFCETGEMTAAGATLSASHWGGRRGLYFISEGIAVDALSNGPELRQLD